MTFHEIIKKEALAFARTNAIVKKGDVVTTSWGGWVNPHKVKIDAIGACLACKFDKKAAEFCATLEMVYYAKRLKADGTVKPQDRDCGIALAALTRSDGKVWKQKRETLNHAAYHWMLPD